MARRKKGLSLGLFLGVMGAMLAGGAVPAQAAWDRDWHGGQLVRLSGRVLEVNRRDSSFRIDSDGDRIDVEVNAAASFTDRDGQRDRRNPFMLDDLRPGERVSVEGAVRDDKELQAKQVRRLDIGANRDDPRRDDNIQGRDPAPIHRDTWGRDERMGDGLVGTVVGAAVGSNRNLRVDVAGREYIIEVPKDVRVRRNGNGLSVHELNRGDRVRVRGDWQGRDRLRARVVEAASGGRYDDRANDSRIFIGTVERLNRRDHSFRLRTNSGSYDVDGDRAGFIGDRRFSDLREGDVVRVVAARVDGRSLRADRIEWTSDRDLRDRPGDDRDTSDRNATLGGTIEDIDFLHRTFRLRSDLAPVNVHVPNDVEIRDTDGGRIAFRDLDEGTRLRIVGVRNSSSGMIIADRVEVLHD